MSAIETLRVIHVDRTRTVLAIRCYAGFATHVVMPLRAIITDALHLGTTALLLSHNHPSGDATPSRADIIATHALAHTAGALGIVVHDHIIRGDGARTSFRAAGLL